jgi:phosphoenolpyruvate carboxylase
MTMETYQVDIRANRDTDELVAEVYNNEDVVEATDRVSYTDDAFSATREGSTLVTTTGEFTADTTVLDVMITRFNDGFEVRVVGDDRELFTERVPAES